MKINVTQFTTLLFIVPLLIFGQNNSWNGIVPLYSTKSDVEKIPSIKQDKCLVAKNTYYCSYLLENQRITVNYAQDKCKGEIPGFDVPRDTVLTISVYDLKEANELFRSLKKNKDKFFLTIDDVFHGFWTNAEEGIRYPFSNSDKAPTSVIFIPKRTDDKLRCNGFPPFSPEGQHFTMDTNHFYNPKFNKKDQLNRILSLLDRFIFELETNEVK